MLYDRFSSMVYRFARQRVATDQDAEDIVSETFMAVAANLENYDATKSKKCTTRILAIAHNKITDYLRWLYAKPEDYIDDSYEIADTHEPSVLDAIHTRHIYDEIMRFVNTLPERQAMIFSLRYSEWLQNKDIAQICGIDEKTVSSLLSMIGRKTKKHLENMSYIS